MRLLRFLALCAALAAVCDAAAAPLRVVGRYLQDIHGNNLMIRGYNVPVYKSGFVDDLDAVAAAVASTQANAVRMEWWAVPPPLTTEYTVANLDRAIQKYYSLGILPIVDLHDLTFGGDDRVTFTNTITAYWTRADVLAVLLSHQDHIVINIANEWGTEAAPASNFIGNYTDAIAALRNAGITAPLMIDAPEGFQFKFILAHGQELLDADPLHNTMLSVHAYWAATDASYAAFDDASVRGIIDSFAQSGLPIVLGEASSNAYTNIPCDPIHYQNLMAQANADGVGYTFWAWYEDGQCGQAMNITKNQDGVTLPVDPGFGFDALYAPAFGVDAAQPATTKADFSPVLTSADLAFTNTSNVDPASTGKDTVFTMTVTNNGPAAATAVVVNTSYDSTAAAIWASPGCVRQGALSIYACAAGTLAAGASAQFKVVLRKDTAGTVFNNASATSATPDADATNNTAHRSVNVLASPAAAAVLRYRLYNDGTKEHLYTTDLNEYNVLGAGGWAQEGSVGSVLNNPGAFNAVTATPYYRLYNDQTFWHHWTTDANEYYTLVQYGNWHGEGVDGYILPTGTAGAIQLYRLNYPYLPGLHHWTVDANEYNALTTSFGWIGEGGSGFVIQ